MPTITQQLKTIKAPLGLWKALGYTPHTGQLDLHAQATPIIHRDPGAASYLTVEASRRWGKTEAARTLLWEAMMQEPDSFGPPYVPVFSDTHEHACKIWDRAMKDLYTKDAFSSLLAGHDRERERVTLKTGAVCQRFSADNPAAMSGEGVTCGIGDESQFVRDEAYSNFLPSLTERGGCLIAFGTAENDGGWFDINGERGDDPDFPEYSHLRFPWYTNPFLPAAAIDVFKRAMSAESFQRLYLAERPKKGETIWTNLARCITGTVSIDPGETPYIVSPPEEGRRYVAALDLAKTDDFTVFSIYDYDTGSLVYFHRMGHLSYGVQSSRVARPMKDYGPHCLVDMTGVGMAAIEQFRESLNQLYQRDWSDRGVYDMQTRGSFEGMVWTNQNKAEMVDKLTILMEYEHIHFPNISPLVRELKKYRKVKTETGKIGYSAPTGFHDDCVSNLLMVAKLLPNFKPTRLTESNTRTKGGWELL